MHEYDLLRENEAFPRQKGYHLYAPHQLFLVELNYLNRVMLNKSQLTMWLVLVHERDYNNLFDCIIIY